MGVLMSALGQKQTFCDAEAMSALPPKADMCSATRHVRFVPIADIQQFGSRQMKTPGDIAQGFIAPTISIRQSAFRDGTAIGALMWLQA
jgi:hypothetical protein